MDINKILGWIETIVVWFLIVMLCLVGLGRLPVNPTSLFDFSASFYYFTVAVIICPKTPLSFNNKLVLGFIAFLYGVYFGLI
jgi:hypothetical protein